MARIEDGLSIVFLFSHRVLEPLCDGSLHCNPLVSRLCEHGPMGKRALRVSVYRTMRSRNSFDAHNFLWDGDVLRPCRLQFDRHKRTLVCSVLDSRATWLNSVLLCCVSGIYKSRENGQLTITNAHSTIKS